ncbi:Hypothetical protein PHPALM_14126 [Phytophthora palmivora]|uniref:CCHC-type domain-containing protein n=1 Tax=Phytophthora palmivora TaxID=4796 RepID=A0A2P4XVJ6_9STRA|nr:Hypothetical protein PHPALM_14126 [Phytophthora palmivora]
MSTNAQLLAEIDRLNQTMAERTRVPSNLLTGKRGRMYVNGYSKWRTRVGSTTSPSKTQARVYQGSPGRPWKMSSTTRSEEHPCGIFREHVLQHFEASNYQAVLREKLQRLKETVDFESYNGEYSAHIFRVEGMSMLDQVLCYPNALKPRTRRYVKLENPETLSDAVDLAVKYTVTHFIDDTRDRQVHQETKKLNNLTVKHGKPFNEKSFRGKGRFKLKADSKRTEGRTCFYCKKLGHVKANCFLWKKDQEKQGKGQPQGPGVVKSATRNVKIENVSVNVLCENPLIYKSRPLFSVTGEISLDGKIILTRRILLDCGATTIYVSKRWVNEHQLETKKFEAKNIRVKLGGNQIVETKLEVVPIEIQIPDLGKIYKCVAVVYATPDEFDCILGIPFFEDMQPPITWKGRQIKGTRSKFLHWERAGEICGSIEEGGPICRGERPIGEKTRFLSRRRVGNGCDIVVKLARHAVQMVIPTVVREQQKYTSAVASSKREGTAASVEDGSSIRGKGNNVEKMFTMGVVDEIGVLTKYITRKKLKKFLRIKTKSDEEPDVMLVLSNETIKRVARTLQQQDQPASVVTAKAQRYLETDWESFQDNPAFKLLMEYKDNVFRPELPEGLPEKRGIEYRINVKDLNLAMYRQQWRQSPEQQREIVRWVIGMVKKKLI